MEILRTKLLSCKKKKIKKTENSVLSHRLPRSLCFFEKQREAVGRGEKKKRSRGRREEEGKEERKKKKKKRGG